ncbi:hypothetical protein [Streptomyces fulvorobeus]|nr:hypothetical protein [Streptomyces fulvorobeus]
MARPGYGKRSTPGQAPRQTEDFALLPERERYIAFSAAEDSKGAPAPLPPAPVPTSGGPVDPVEPSAPQPTPVREDSPSPAYRALAQLGCSDARLALSADDCAALESLAGEWLARGVSAEYLTHALTAGLPATVDVPRGFVRRRLRDKMPPRLPAPAATPVRLTLVECTTCGVPGRPEALPDGLCRACRPTLATATECVTDSGVAHDVHALVDRLRHLARNA